MKKIILALLISFTALLADYVIKSDGTLTPATTQDVTTPPSTPISTNCNHPNYGAPINVSTLGIKGDGSDEQPLLESILNKGGVYLFTDITVSLAATVTINQPVNVKLIFENSKLVMLSDSNNRKGLIYAYPEVKHVEIEGGVFDGNNQARSGFYLNTSYYIHDTVIKNMASRVGDNDAAVGIYSRFKHDSCVEISNNQIMDIYGESNQKLMDTQGASRGIMLVWDSVTQTKLNAYIYNNKIDHIYGEEGGGMFIFDHEVSKQASTSHIEIKDNTISRCNRRMIKGHSSNMIIENNIFESYRYGEKEAINSTAMVQAYQGAKDIQIIGNKFRNYGNHRQSITLEDASNVVISKNSFYSRRNGAPSSTGQSLEIRYSCNNIMFNDNMIDTDADNQIWLPSFTDSAKNINILNNRMIVNEGNKKFTLMTSKYNDILFENNIVDGTEGDATTGSFSAFVEVNKGAVLNNTRFVGNKILPGTKKINNGRFIMFWGSDEQGGVIFNNNTTEGSDTKYYIRNSTNIEIIE